MTSSHQLALHQFTVSNNEDALGLSVNQSLEEEKHAINGHQLIEATKFGNIDTVKQLLEKGNIDINSTGTIENTSSSKKKITALWLAAVNNNKWNKSTLPDSLKFDLGCIEIVKMLIDHGAAVDFCTTLKSTPLYIACYRGHFGVVKYLIEHGANVNFINRPNNMSCLMIASSKGFIGIVKYLLENGADVNKQCNMGATAMHYAAEANSLNTAKLLLEFNAQQLKNEQCLTPILVAAAKPHFYFVKYLFDTLKLTREEKIQVFELIGASLYNFLPSEPGFNALMSAMEMRYNHDPVITKKISKLVEAYDNRVECQTIEDLTKIKHNPVALMYESLIIRERILGDSNLLLVPFIMMCANNFAISRNFKSCFKLFYYAMQLTQKNQCSLDRCIREVIKVFNRMNDSDILSALEDVKTLLCKIVEDIKINQKRKLMASSVHIKEEIERKYIQSYIYEIFALIVIISNKFLFWDVTLTEVGDIMKTIVELNKLDVRTSDGKSLLHLCLENTTNIPGVLKTKFCVFPNYLALKLLIKCGANVNAVDKNNNTPLHSIGYFVKYNPNLSHDSENLGTKKIVMKLLKAGAHTDFVNNDGQCPHTGYLNTVFNLTNKTPLSLECLSAKVLKNQWPKKSYQDLPWMLKEFINLH